MCYDKTELLNGIQDTQSSSNFGQNHRPLKSLSPQPPAADPYAFSDEASSTPATISRGSMRNSRDELFQRPFKVSMILLLLLSKSVQAYGMANSFFPD